MRCAAALLRRAPRLYSSENCGGSSRVFSSINPYELAILIALLQTPVPVPLGIRLARPHTASERRGNHERLMTREHQRQREGCRLRLNELPNGEPRITQYYTAQLTINVTLTKEEAEALACFL